MFIYELGIVLAQGRPEVVDNGGLNVEYLSGSRSNSVVPTYLGMFYFRVKHGVCSTVTTTAVTCPSASHVPNSIPTPRPITSSAQRLASAIFRGGCFCPVTTLLLRLLKKHVRFPQSRSQMA